MARVQSPKRRIALFVEGHSECGNAQQKTLPTFFHRWLDPQLPDKGKVGIQAVNFKGVSHYLNDLPNKVKSYLSEGRASFVIGLVDLYGLPDRIDLTNCRSVKEKVDTARRYIQNLVPKNFKKQFRQHFAVHELEAWLLAYPDEWSDEKVRNQIRKKPPEEVNFDLPPAKFLKKILGRYHKTLTAKKLFSKVDPQIAIDTCPYLKLLSEDLLNIAKKLQ